MLLVNNFATIIRKKIEFQYNKYQISKPDPKPYNKISR